MVLERKLVWTSNNNPKVATATLRSDAANSVVTVSKKIVARASNNNGIHAHRPCKTPLIKKRHLKTRLDYAKCNMKKKIHTGSMSYDQMRLNLNSLATGVWWKNEKPTTTKTPSLHMVVIL